MKTKKASIADPIFIAIVLLGFALGGLIMFKIADELNTKFQEDTQLQEYDLENRSKDSFEQIRNMYPGVIDNSFLFLVILLSIGALALAFMVKIHPVFFVFFLIAMVIIIFLCGVFSNIYLEAANQAEMTALAEELIFMTNVMWVLPFIVGILGFVMAIILYKSWSETQ